jgi:hypothetical protein
MVKSLTKDQGMGWELFEELEQFVGVERVHSHSESL